MTSDRSPGYGAVIFDVDGVLVASPHEQAWRESLCELMTGEWSAVRDRTTWSEDAFSSQVYRQVMSGKPRMSGALAGLQYFGVPDATERAPVYADLKQRVLLRLIDERRFHAYPDALRFVLAVRGAGMAIAAASSSKNAHRFLRAIRLDLFARESSAGRERLPEGMTLLDAFDADLSGRDFAQGKPNPEIFLAAAAELDVAPSACVVVEDAVSGIQAAKAGTMVALGTARAGDETDLERAGADLVVSTLDDVDVEAFVTGRLIRRSG
ncbi:HAD family hydrolase [Rhodococcus chondri]|uniref:HAD-IA family hydrolase n=1 Tax=Rhodococcus chondri TaxID=3065941 RepID=A0ABU7JR45_9NOCA|nr:HAD-IA family hydrolase [Rhodococcus sp. CC-R104]MEE2032490.1 HAD-IA family hydrolase [Rhodococcus sp. CC-R104]